MQIISFPAHFQSVYTNFYISSFSLISCNLIAALLHANRSPFATRKRSGVNAKEKRTWNPISSLPVSKADHAVYNDSHCLTHRALTASLGMRQSPRGLRLTLLTLGPSGRQERLNCWLKKRR